MTGDFNVTGDFNETPTGTSEQRILKLLSHLEQSKLTFRNRRYFFPVPTIAVATVLTVGIWFRWRTQSAYIIEVTTIQGPVRWTGDAGNVMDELETGQKLTGGSLKTTALNSLATFTFPGGSTVSTTGNSAVIITDNGQKKLHLRSGVLSADVQRQPDNRPLYVTTPTARLEVLGTRFDVVANAGGESCLPARNSSERYKRLTGNQARLRQTTQSLQQPAYKPPFHPEATIAQSAHGRPIWIETINGAKANSSRKRWLYAFEFSLN